MVYSEVIRVSTSLNKHAVDITGEVARVVEASGITEGLAVVFTKHTTTGLFINERESGLLEDIEGALANLVPQQGPYRHDRVDDNAASHIQSILLSPSLTVPITEGGLELGAWQALFLAERDGPRTRTVIVRVVGD